MNEAPHFFASPPNRSQLDIVPEYQKMIFFGLFGPECSDGMSGQALLNFLFRHQEYQRIDLAQLSSTYSKTATTPNKDSEAAAHPATS